MELSSTFAIIILAIIGFITYHVFSSKRKEAKIRRELAQQNLPIATVPNIFVSAFRGKHQDLVDHELVQKYGKVFGANVMATKTIYLAEPELIQLVLSKEFTSFTNRREFPFKDRIFSSILSVAEDEQWKRLRSIVTPTFSTGKLRQMKPRIDDTIQTLLDNFDKIMEKNGNIVNVKEQFGAYSMDTIIQIAFGTKVDSLADPNNKIILNSKKIFSNDIKLGTMILVLAFLIIPKYAMKLSNYLGVNDWVDFFEDFSIKIIKQKREELKKNSGKNLGKANNFLEMLLEAEAESGQLASNGAANGKAGEVDENQNKKTVKFMTNDEMIAQCIQFFLAAYDTTTTAISLCIYSLALNPSIQERLYEEICTKLDELKAKSENAESCNPLKLVTFDSLGQFKYLNAVLNETLRLYPPVATERTASRDIRLETEDGSHRLEVKKGDVMRFPVYTIHRDPEQFPDPDTFNPDRFIGEPSFHKYAYLPFGQGPRNCVARSLALIEAKMAILSVVYRYRFSTCEQTKIPMEFYNNGQILNPKQVCLKVEKR